MADSSIAANAGVALGTVSVVLVIGYIYWQEFMTASGSMIDNIGYAILFILLFIFCLDTAYMGLYSSGKSTQETRNGLIGTSMILLAIVNIALGYAVYKLNGTVNRDYVQYFNLMLPANMLITILATSIIIMQKLTAA